MSKILIVDDEQSICWGVSKLGQGMGHATKAAASAEEGLRLAEAWRPDLVVLDVRLPGMDGLTAVDRFRELLGDVPIIVVTAFGDMQTAVRAIGCGAYEYLVKPFDLAEIRAVIESALQRHEPSAAPAPHADGELIGQTAIMRSLFKRVALAAASDASVLLRGESGVGKEVVARAIHRHSPRRDGAFVAVNVAALSPGLAESELFGHVDGAFTGASRSRKGLLVQADGGTLFLDEVADIPLPVQVKLLRALEEGEVLPVGADRPIKTRFRVVAATHQDLNRSIASGQFRHDLYFRICAFEVAIPPLRERPDDIPPLVSHFAAQLGDGTLRFADRTLEELKRRPWTGNVRELRNAVEHASVVARSGVVMPEHLPASQPNFEGSAEAEAAPTRLAEASSRRAAELLDDPDAQGDVYSRLLSEVEGPLLASAMQRFDNECAPAARALGLHRTTLRKKLDDLRQTD